MEAQNAPGPADLLRTLPNLNALTTKVSNVHGSDEPRLHEVRATFGVVAEALHGLVEGAEKKKASEEAARGFERLHELTNGYAAPASACRSYRAMLDGLAQLERESMLWIRP
jgi:regulator of cell morphogenesis and NO signaling